MNFESLKSGFDRVVSVLAEWAVNPDMLAKISLVVVALVLAFSISEMIKKRSLLDTEKLEGEDGSIWPPIRKAIYNTRLLAFPLLVILFLGIAIEISENAFERSWLVRIFQSLAVIYLLHFVIARYIRSRFVELVFKWGVTPVAVLYVLGWLDEVTSYLDSISFDVGIVTISTYGILRALIFGSILFWLGRISNTAGQRIIRRQADIDVGTREVFAKLFQVVLSTVFFILLLRLLGVNLTALAIFGGALGVGLAFGLQSIASNFISGIIILLDRSIKIGDYVELEDGTGGRIREINMRSSLLETFDGKDVMVPNEQFITTRFVNWTHNNEKQRYSIEFQVAYKTDIPAMLDIIKEVVRSHPSVLNNPDGPIAELADAEISGFGDSGIDILVEFWMDGIDDGDNRVGADLLLMIWQALKSNNIEIPFPQREVNILSDKNS